MNEEEKTAPSADAVSEPEDCCGRFLTVAADITAGFQSGSSDSHDRTVDNALQVLGKLADADRATLFLIIEGSDRMLLTNEWNAAGAKPLSGILQTIDLPPLGPHAKLLTRREAIVIDDFDHLPFDTPGVRDLSEKTGARSWMGIPLLRDEAPFGFLGLSRTKRALPWSRPVQAMARLVGKIMEGSLARKRTEDLLRENEIHHHTLFDHLPDAVFEADAVTGVIVDVNRQAEELTGRLRNELLGMHQSALHPPNWDEQSRRVFRTHAGKELSLDEAPILHKSGRIVPVTISASRININGKNRLLGIFRDMSRQKSAEAGLLREQERSKTYLDLAAVLFIALDREGKISMANRKTAEILGFREDEIIGKEWFEIAVPANARDEVRTVFQTLMSGHVEPVAYYESSIIDRFGKQRTIAWHNTLLREEDGTIIGTLSAGEDVTGRKQVQEQEERHIRDLSFLTQSALDFLELDPEGDIHDLIARKVALIAGNASLVAVSEIETERKTWQVRSVDGPKDMLQRVNEAIGMDLRNLHGEQTDENTRMLRKNRLRKLDTSLTEFSAGALSEDEARSFARVCDLAEIHTIALMRPDRIFGLVSIYLPHGQRLPNPLLIEAYVGQASVALERRAAEQESNLLREQVRHMQKMEAIGRLAGGIAHDFNNLLMGIVGGASVLKSKSSPEEEVYQEADFIESTGRNAFEIVRQLLRFARKDAARFETLDLNDLLANLHTILSHTIDKRIRLKIRRSPDLLVINADRVQIEQIVMNLAVNAGDAIDGTGTITIGTRKVDITEDTPDLPSGSYASLFVSDTGSGIDPEVFERIFDPYFTTKETGKGTGMGLSVAFGLARSHGGTLQVETEPDGGSTFTLLIPLMKDPSSQPSADRVPTPPKKGQGRILLVDDEKVVRQVVRKMLAPLGYELTVVPGGEEAVSALRAVGPGHFDLVLMDLTMPHMNGIECLEELKKRDPALRAVVTTGEAPDDRDGELLDAGFLAVLRKPFTMETLAAMITDQLSPGS